MSEDQLIEEILADHDSKFWTELEAKPFSDVWSYAWTIGTEKQIEIEQELQQRILDTLHVAWEDSENNINYFKQEEKKKGNVEPIFEKHWAHYINKVEKYGLFEYWYDDYWPYPNKPDATKLIRGLWGQLFALCDGSNLPFGVGLTLVRSVFSVNLTLAKLNATRFPLTTPSEINEKTKTEEKLKIAEAYNSFSDLFFNKAEIEESLNALRNYRPDKPILGEGKNWLGSKNDRGLIVGWIERMEEMYPPKIRKIPNRKILVGLLNAYFDNLNMGADARVFNNPVDPDVKKAFIALQPK